MGAGLMEVSLTHHVETAVRGDRHQLRIGNFVPAAPIVLAPMAGVTNAAFRSLCRSFGPDLIYVNEMVMAAAVLHRNGKTSRMMTFAEDEHPRSLQIYGSDPVVLAAAVRQLCDEGRVDHIDLNFGCPAAKVTRRGGGAAVPARPRVLEAILRAAVGAATPYGVPVTAKFRMGLTDDLLTHIQTGQICADEGVAWIALHARTAEQHYAGLARWDAIGELKSAVNGIPVLGNGDIWEARDAVEMMAATGCDGVVVGRGCLGRPWLFGDLRQALSGAQIPGPRRLGEVCEVMFTHAQLLVDHFEGATDDRDSPSRRRKALIPEGVSPAENRAMRDFRKHTSWYLTGYPVGPQVRREMAMISSLAELAGVIDGLDRNLELVAGGERITRGHSNGPIRVALPDGYLDDLDSCEIPDDDEVMALSGG
jgi:nifR3 family TIM-barrel protein